MSSSNSPCAACKCLRRKCTQECVFAPYFPPDNPQKFTNVHKVFGASNVTKLLNELNPNQREDAVNSLAYEADYRLRDPIYGCVGLISILQHRLKQVQLEIELAKKELSTYIGSSSILPMMNHTGFMQQHHPNHGTAYQAMPYNMQPMMGVPTAVPRNGNLIIREPQQHHQRQQQQQMLEAQQLAAAAAAAAREQEMLRNYEEQQRQNNDLVMFNNGFEDTGVQVSAARFNQMAGPVAVAAMQPSLALGSYENHQYQLHHQQQHRISQQSQDHQLQLQSNELQLQSNELLLQRSAATAHHQQQLGQPQASHSLPQKAKGSDEGRSIGSSC